MFTSVPLLQLPAGAGKEEARRYVEQAQMSGWPILIRPASSRANLTSAAALKSLVASFNKELDSSDVGTFDPECESWAGIRSLSDSEQEDLKRVLGDDFSPGGLFKAMSEGKTITGKGGRRLPLGSKMTLQNYALDPDDDNAKYLKALKDGGYLESLSSPVWSRDIEDYATFFIHGKGHRTGAHIDDSAGGTYFYLKVITGKKRLRIWPILDNEGLEAWRDAEKRLGAQGVEFPFRGFIFPAETSGGMSSRWTELGFEWGISPDGGDDRTGATQIVGPMGSAYSCYVEVEINAGEEIFVGSAVPHQVETLEPALAVSKNYRFTNFGWTTRGRMRSLAEAIGRNDLWTEGAWDEVMSIDDGTDEWGLKGADVAALRKLWNQGVRPRTRRAGESPTSTDVLFRDVIMTWADPSIAANPGAVHTLAGDLPLSAIDTVAHSHLRSGPGGFASNTVHLLCFLAVLLAIGVLVWRRLGSAPSKARP